ncbi:putative cytochrome b5 [Tilletiopsis washingtonensis]|uniref:Putative cytochrome b5 n=1 Tax=Tilletiopsis washingtonensis TaxID=58919 RepID=A0A316Z972_9BASI|nr:putative cytochrome b5 [Tilletiopsis washingtonensis]PWN97538.1 putative cytochrome b5 [Tilletiopsis washingtonensis]
MSKTFSAEEVKKHASEESVWVVVDGGVYDVTSFLDDHPGGKKILLRNGGKDATEAFWTYHSEKVLKKQGGKLKIGELEPSSKL